MGSREQKIETSFILAYEKLQSDVAAFGSDISETVAGMSERAPNADRTQIYETAAGELENIAFPDLLDGDFDDVSYTIDDRKSISKAERLGNLVAAAEAILGQVESAVSEYENDYDGDVDDDPYGDDLREFSDELSDIFATLSNIEF